MLTDDPAPNKFEKFRSKTIPRSRMKAPPYDPRKALTSEQKTKLRASIEQFGLVLPPVWNKRSGNIVGGNKCIGILDELHGGADYSLVVAVVDLDEEKEKALSVILNAPSLI